VPKSRVRKKKTDAYVRSEVLATPKKKQPSPVWFGGIVLGTMLVGVAWLVAYYVSGGSLPVAKFQAWNVVIGFAWIATGFALSTQWH
jgi:Cell division protein CrgA